MRKSLFCFALLAAACAPVGPEDAERVCARARLAAEAARPWLDHPAVSAEGRARLNAAISAIDVACTDEPSADKIELALVRLASELAVVRANADAR